jgi:hypothetical protein
MLLEPTGAHDTGPSIYGFVVQQTFGSKGQPARELHQQYELQTVHKFDEASLRELDMVLVYSWLLLNRRSEK